MNCIGCLILSESSKRTINILQKEKKMKWILVKWRRSQNMNKEKAKVKSFKVKRKNDERVLSDRSISTCLI
jgi:hypothetical protein